jgi:hypothetical protein
MKKLIFLALILLCTSCESSFLCNEPDPKAPYGTPDDTSFFDGPDGYRSITYTYYCRSGQYVAVTYTRADACTKYEKSEFVSSGICQ